MTNTVGDNGSGSAGQQGRRVFCAVNLGHVHVAGMVCGLVFGGREEGGGEVGDGRAVLTADIGWSDEPVWACGGEPSGTVSGEMTFKSLQSALADLAAERRGGAWPTLCTGGNCIAEYGW